MTVNWNENMPISAEIHAYLKGLKFVHPNGCTLAKRALREAKATGHLECLAKENGQKRRDNEELRMCLPKKS